MAAASSRRASCRRPSCAFDVQVLHGTRYPELLELASPLVATSFTIPDEALADVATGG